MPPPEGACLARASFDTVLYYCSSQLAESTAEYRPHGRRREPDAPSLRDDSPSYHLLYPPTRISAEPLSAVVFEFFGGEHQADVAFLDEVEIRQTITTVPLCDEHNKTQISGGHFAFGG